jgi:predicted HTH transcriptional regulator
MNPSALEILLQEGEGTLLEYKESLSASFARELVALANGENFIEKAGTGIRRMREDTRQHGCPGPEFQADGFFAAVFRPRIIQEAQVEAQEAQEATASPRSASRS